MRTQSIPSVKCLKSKNLIFFIVYVLFNKNKSQQNSVYLPFHNQFQYTRKALFWYVLEYEFSASMTSKTLCHILAPSIWNDTRLCVFLYVFLNFLRCYTICCSPHNCSDILRESLDRFPRSEKEENWTKYVSLKRCMLFWQNENEKKRFLTPVHIDGEESLGNFLFSSPSFFFSTKNRLLASIGINFSFFITIASVSRD